MSRLIKRLIAFLDPRPAPTPEFEDRMNQSRTRANKESEVAISETQRLRRQIQTMSDRLILDPPPKRRDDIR